MVGALDSPFISKGFERQMVIIGLVTNVLVSLSCSLSLFSLQGFLYFLVCKDIWVEVIDRIETKSCSDKTVGPLVYKKLLAFGFTDDFWKEHETNGLFLSSFYLLMEGVVGRHLSCEDFSMTIK